MFSKKQVKQTFFNSRKRINIRREFASQNRLRINFERKLRKQLKGYFTKVFNDFATEYENMGLIETAFSRNQDMIFKILDNHYRVVIEAFGTRMLKQFTKEDSQFEAIYREFAREHTGKNIVGINQTTRKHIAKIVTINLAENLGVAQIAKKIREESDSRFTRLRSATIARTETHNASSFANHMIAQSMNIPDQQKQWVATLDNRSRDAHLAMNGKTVPIDEDFIVDGRPMGYPSDPRGGASNVINCRCVVIYTSPEDVVTDDTTLMPRQRTRQARDTEAVSLDKLLSSPRDASFTHETFTVGSRAVMLKNLDDRARSSKKEYRDFFEESEFFDDYGQRFRREFKNQKLYENSMSRTQTVNRVKQKVELTDEALAIVEQAVKEVDELAKRFKVPKINSIVVGHSRRASASMGDGFLFLNANRFNSDAKKTSKANPNRLTEKERAEFDLKEKELERLELEIENFYKKKPTELGGSYTEWYQEIGKLRATRNELRDSYQNLKEKSGFKKPISSSFKRGSKKDKPYTASEYYDNGVDKSRSTIYHEFGHHIHQTVGLNKAYSYNKKNGKYENYLNEDVNPIEAELRKDFGTKRERKATDTATEYSEANSKEWFAENFSLYFMGKKELVSPQAKQLIERIMKEQNGIK